MNAGLLRWALVIGVAASTTGAAAAAPRLLRNVDAFRVERVRVEGTRLLVARSVVAASGIERTSTIFDDPAPWRAGVLRLPLVAEATVERELPGTIVIRVTESSPVALLATPELRPVDGRGVLLPIRPGEEPDLPVLTADGAVKGGRVTDAAVLEALAGLERIRSGDPSLWAGLSDAAPIDDGGLRLLLRQPAGMEVWLSSDASPASLHRLDEALADLARRGELAEVQRVDARFADQVVVSFNSNTKQ